MAKNTIYKGNTISNFGRNLPVPYVEKIEIRDVPSEDLPDVYALLGFDEISEIPLSKITVFTSLLLNTDDEFMLSEFTENLFNDLNINFMALTNVDLINSLRESKRNLKSVIESSADGQFRVDAGIPPNEEGELYNQFKNLPLVTFSEALEFSSEYDENTNEVQKASLDGGAGEAPNATGTIDLYVPSVSNLDNLTIFCGVSVGSPEHLIQFEDIVLALSFGDLAIEIVKIDGVLNSRDSIGFFDTDDAYFPGNTLMGLNARYHMAEDFDQEDIKEAIDSLKRGYGKIATKDAEFERVLDNIDFIFSEYGNTPMYLVQLNRYRRVIKNQDQATRPGQFYERFRRLLSNANTALISFPQVTKRITYSSKIRDHRPQQWTALPSPTWHELDDEMLHPQDFLYPLFLQTTLAKYVSAHSTTGEDSLFQPEAPYTPNAMENAYIDAISAKFDRFNNENQPNEKGMDNIGDWVAKSRTNIINNAVEDFKQAIQNFQDWACGRTSPDSTWSGTAPYGRGDYSFSDGPADRRVYYGGDVGDAGEEVTRLESEGSTEESEVSDWEMERNMLAFRSAKKFFGYHGNPESANCTLEFGHDTPSIGSWRHTGHATEGRRIWQPREGTWTSSGAGSSQNLEISSGDHKSRQYKCFYQSEGYINVVGYGAENNEDEDNNVFGQFLRVKDHETADWGLRSAAAIADTGGDSIRKVLEDDDFLNNTSLTGLYDACEQAFATARAYYLRSDGLYTNLITNVSVWNEIAAEENLLHDDGTVRDNYLKIYARKIVDEIEEYVLTALNTLVYGNRDCRTYRLRWCPDIISPTNKYDSSRSIGQDPYGGSWDNLAQGRSRRDPHGNRYSTGDDEEGRRWFMQGGLGTVPGGHDRSKTSVGIGRHEFNPGAQAADRVWNRWQNVWRAEAKDAIKDAITLVAEYHGLSVSTGEHRTLSHVDIVVEKYGWFFFDLEKYIQKHSALSRYVNPGVFQKYFEWGRDMVNYTIRIDDVHFYRTPTYTDASTGAARPAYGLVPGPHVHLKLNYNSSFTAQATDVSRLKFIGTCGLGGSVAAGNAPYAKIKQMDVGGWKDIAVAREDGEEAYLKDKSTGQAISSHNQFSYLMQRNYDFAYSDAVPDDYRMACFAYNYYIDDDEALKGPDSVGARVTIRDRSDIIITKYHSYLVEILEGFTDYVALAEENCAYNSYDGQFNQFFINAMDDQYGDNMTSAPWLRAASAYALYEDMYHGKYGGEYSIVLEAASSQADNINPYTGDLGMLQEFAVKLQEMVERVAVDAGWIAILGTQSSLGAVPLEDFLGVGTPQYTEFEIGVASDETGPGGIVDGGWILLDEGIIDYVANLSDSFPPLPEPTLDDPNPGGSTSEPTRQED